MQNYDDTIQPTPDICIHERKTPPSKLSTVGGFLAELQRIAREAHLDLSLQEFQPFWEMLLAATHVAMRKPPAMERKWRLRSRPARPPGDAEIHARMRLHANRLVNLAFAIRHPSDDLLNDRSHQAQLLRAVIRFSKALQNCPDILIKAGPSEFQALETAAKRFTNTN
jgi:hypothetical protein